MRRRSKSVGGSAKTGLRNTAKQKRRHGSITQRRRAIRASRRETETEPLTHELNTIAEQQHATTEVLKLISSSSADPQQVLPTYWQVPFGSAMPITALSIAGTAMLCISSQRIYAAGVHRTAYAVASQTAPALRHRPYAGDQEPHSHRRFSR